MMRLSIMKLSLTTSQHNNTQPNNIQHNDSRLNNTQHNDTKYKGFTCDIQDNITLCNYTECHVFLL
jgi:hypothetical protein